MKIKDLKDILYSNRGNIQFAIVWDIYNNVDIENGCSIEYAVETYGERELLRIEAVGNHLLLTIK